MGHGITQVAAQTVRCEVYICDTKQEFIDNGMRLIKNSLKRYLEKGEITAVEVNQILSRIHPVINLNEAVVDADLIIEAVSENLDIKKDVLNKIGKIAKPSACIVSNTSSIAITELALAVDQPERFAGMHFFNPPQLMKLVEVIRGAKTSNQTVDIIFETAKRMGKEPIMVKKDVAGFVVNRVLILALNEAVSLVQEGVATPEDIDKAIKLGLNWPMGPLTLIDFIGVDTVLAICKVLAKDLGPKYSPNPLLLGMVEKNLLGRKTGKGFFEWTNDN